MSFNFNLTLLWAGLGILSWVVGRASHNLPQPKPETLELLRSSEQKTFVQPPHWAKTLCALSQKRKGVDTTSLQFQLGGMVLFFLSILAGFLVTKEIFAAGVLISIFLYYSIPPRLFRRWPQA